MIGILQWSITSDWIHISHLLEPEIESAEPVNHY